MPVDSAFICAVKSNRSYTDPRWIADPVRDPRTRRIATEKIKKRERDRFASSFRVLIESTGHWSRFPSYDRLRAKIRQGSANDAIRASFAAIERVSGASFVATASEMRGGSRRVSGGWRFISLLNGTWIQVLPRVHRAREQVWKRRYMH